MATGQLQGLRHEIRDIVGDGSTYNGLAGKPGLSFEQQRAEFKGIAPRVAAKVESLRAKADELAAKQAEVEAVVVNALGIIDAREADPNFAASTEPVEDPDFDEDEELDEGFEEDDDEEFEEEDFEEFDEEDEDDNGDPSFPEKVKEKVKEVF